MRYFSQKNDNTNEDNTGNGVPYYKQRLCKCGCGLSFYPRRKDQVYIDRQHGNFAYNHGARKRKQKAIHKIEKCLRRNERILEKYFAAGDGNAAICSFISLAAEGFNPDFFTGLVSSPEGTYNVVYKYAFLRGKYNGHSIIKIILK
jgi:hypothetical protein